MIAIRQAIIVFVYVAAVCVGTVLLIATSPMWILGIAIERGVAAATAAGGWRRWNWARIIGGTIACVAFAAAVALLIELAFWSGAL